MHQKRLESESSSCNIECYWPVSGTADERPELARSFSVPLGSGVYQLTHLLSNAIGVKKHVKNLKACTRHHKFIIKHWIINHAEMVFSFHPETFFWWWWDGARGGQKISLNSSFSHTLTARPFDRRLPFLGSFFKSGSCLISFTTSSFSAPSYSTKREEENINMNASESRINQGGKLMFSERVI